MFVLGFRCFARTRFSVSIDAKVAQFSCRTSSNSLYVQFPMWCLFFNTIYWLSSGFVTFSLTKFTLKGSHGVKERDAQKHTQTVTAQVI